MSNAWPTCPRDRDNPSKGGLIPDETQIVGSGLKAPAPGEGAASHQLAGEVMAHRGNDG